MSLALRLQGRQLRAAIVAAHMSRGFTLEVTMEIKNDTNKPFVRLMPKKTVLVLWNQGEEDVYEILRAAAERQVLHANPDLATAPSEVATVAEEIDAICDALRQGPYEVVSVNIRDDVDRLIGAIRLHQPDVIVNLVEFFYDDEALEPNVAGLYELFDIPYTGNTPHTLAACQRKVRTKLLLEDAGLPIAPYFVVEREPIPDPSELELDYPLIVKPAREDASGGIEPESVVHDYDALLERCRYLFREFEQPALVEEYIEGREIHAAVLGNGRPEVLPLFEMEFDEPDDGEWEPQIITYSAKWDPLSRAFYSMEAQVPARDVSPELEARIRQISIAAYRVMGCRDYARIDMRVDEDGNPYILEVNPNPDLAEGSAFMLSAEASGRTYASTLAEIVELAHRRAQVVDTIISAPPTDEMTRRYGNLRPDQPCPTCGLVAPAPTIADAAAKNRRTLQ